MGRRINLLAEDFLKLGNELYFAAKDTNVIFKVDIVTGAVSFVDCIPDESIYEKCLCYKILIWNNELIFVPMNAKKIWKYNIKSKQWHGIGIEKYENIKNKSFQAFIHENDLFMIGCGYPAVFQVDLITGQLSVIEKPFEHLNKRKGSDSTIFFRHNFVQKGEKIFMASCRDNSVLEFDLHDKKVLFHEVGNRNNKYSGIAWDGKNFWVSPFYKTSIVKWDGKTSVAEYALPYEKIKEEIGFSGVVNTKYGLLFYGKKCCSILTAECGQEINMHIIPNTYMFLREEESSTFILDTCGNLIIKNDNEKRIIQLSVEQSGLKEFQSERGNCRSICFTEPKQESVFFDVNDLINYTYHKTAESAIMKEGSIGYSVWNILGRGISLRGDK